MSIFCHYWYIHCQSSALLIIAITLLLTYAVSFITECQSDFWKQGCFFLLDGQHFDALYSVLWHFKELDANIKDKVFEFVIKGNQLIIICIILIVKFQ